MWPESFIGKYCWLCWKMNFMWITKRMESTSSFRIWRGLSANGGRNCPLADICSVPEFSRLKVVFLPKIVIFVSDIHIGGEIIR
jgi:hypothetical protein